MIFYRALGRLLASRDGLRAAHLPKRIGVAAAAEICKAANSERNANDVEPYALLVDLVGNQHPQPSKTISLAETIKYRRGNRLFLILDSSMGLASIDRSVKILMSENYPEGASAPIDFDSLASIISNMILDTCDIPSNALGNEFLSRHLVALFETLVDLHKNLSKDSSGDWNLHWIHHVGEGVENFVNLLRLEIRNDPQQETSGFVERYLFPSFGLPSPENGLAIRGKTSGLAASYEVALDSHWSNSQEVGVTLEHLKAKLILPHEHPLSELNWDHFDSLVAAEDSVLIAFLKLASETPEATKVMAVLGEEDFFHPTPLSVGGILSITAGDEADPRKFPVLAERNRLHFIRASEKSEEPNGSWIFTSEKIRISVPSLQPVSESDLTASKIALAPYRSKKFTFEGNAVIENESLVFEGRFAFKAGKAPFRNLGQIHRLKLNIPQGDVLLGRVDDKATSEFVLLPPFRCGILIADIKSNGSVGKFTHLGPSAESSEFDDENSFRHELATEGTNQILAIWGSDAILGTEKLHPTSTTSGVSIRDIMISSSLTVSVDDVTFEIENPESTVFIESPIIAAAKKAFLSQDPPSQFNRESLYGRLDDLISKKLEAGTWQSSQMHFLLPEDQEFDFGNVEPQGPGAFMTSSDVYQSWQASAGVGIDTAFQNGPEVSEFLAAFEKLGILESLKRRSKIRDLPEWSSRTSWEHLWLEGRGNLDEYLQAYSKMVEAARLNSDAETLFWAAYPFSASVWDTRSTGECRLVLLSPLHPLRLYWLASTEWALRRADNSEDLAGTVEGWNIPSLGPSPIGASAFMSVPSDSGKGQLFLGWSMLVSASVAGFQAPYIPLEIAGCESPGGGSSGLNKSSTVAALKDYRRINPHVSTITVDLAATSKTPRSSEIDKSILATISDWASREKSSLPGGIRVFDSLNRGGQPPISEVSSAASNLGGIPMAWTRYEHNHSETIRCNVRFLQDPGLRLEVSKGQNDSNSANRGILGEFPLRRFEAQVWSGQGSFSESRPGLRASSVSGPFTKAIQSVENTEFASPSIRSKIFQALLVDKNAEWTVSGESLIGPSGVANLLAHGAGNQMLWEWRPPIFTKGDDLALEQRPFISVARIPDSFKSQVNGLLAKALNREPEAGEVDKVLGKLGSRGVGLSSLVTMGGTHAAGALGFYLSISLLDQIKSADLDVFVMPLDACDSFLRVLAGNSQAAELTKRADLLAIVLSDSAVTFVPVEIKFYGLGVDGSGGTSLPSVSNSALDEAVNQVFETKKLLDLIVAKYAEILDGNNLATRSVWLNALMAFIEAAVKLNPNSTSNPTRLATRLENLVSGLSGLQTGVPLVTYYLHNGSAVDGSNFQYEIAPEPEKSFALFASNVTAAFGLLNEGTLPEIAKWQELFSTLVTPAASLAKDSLARDQGIQETDLNFVFNGEAQQDKGETGYGAFQETEVAMALAEEVGTEDGETELSEVVPAIEQSESVNTSGVESIGIVSTTSGIADWRTAWDPHLGVRTTVGWTQNTLARTVADYWPGNTALSHMNVGVVGNLGTGKTQFLRSLVAQVRHSAEKSQDNPLSFLIFDYKRDYKDKDFLEAVGGRVLSPDEGIPLNVLAITGPYSRNKAYKRAMAFCDVLEKIYANVGPVQRDRLTQVIVDLFESDSNRQAPSLSLVLSTYQESNGKPDSVTSILNKFVLPGIFVEEPDRLEPFEEIMKGSVVVVSLNEFGADADTKNALVILMLDLYYEYMLDSKKWKFSGESPQIRRLNSFLLIDEATNIMQYNFPVLKSLLLEGREWGFGVILASQYLSHFKTTKNNYGEALKTWVIHQVPSVKQNELVQLGLANATPEMVNTIANLKVHEAIYSSLGFQGIKIKGLPFYDL